MLNARLNKIGCSIFYFRKFICFSMYLHMVYVEMGFPSFLLLEERYELALCISGMYGEPTKSL